MKLLSVVAARSSWLFDFGDLNPEGRAITDLFALVRDRYHFAKAPTSFTDLDPVTKSLTFRQGAFRKKKGATKAVDLTIYSDGLTATTLSSTADTDAFLHDLLNSLCSDFGLRYSPEIIRKKYYLSEVIVRIDRSLSNMSPKLNEFARRLSSKVDLQGGPPFEFGGLSFWTDSFSASVKTEPFTIERKAAAPFSEKRYFSKAPLQTADHLALLTEFEQLLA